MNVLLFLNGAEEGSQTGQEDGFKYLLKIKKISKLIWFYYINHARDHSNESSLIKMEELANKFQPDLIIIFHIGKFKIDRKFILRLKNLDSKPTLVYDEGDMYGGWSKPVTSSMKIMFKNVDFVSIRGLGKWYKTVKKYNKNIIYTPHSNSLYRFSKTLNTEDERQRKFLFIGSSVGSRLGNIRRLSGAKGRENFVKKISNDLPEDVIIYGKRWGNLSGYQGILNFNKQFDVCKKYWFHISYEHYPEIPYYFSSRLPIALAAGQIYICHYHKGYEKIFKNCDFIYFFNSYDEAVDIMNCLKDLSLEQLQIKSINARKWLENNLNADIVWSNLFNAVNIKKTIR